MTTSPLRERLRAALIAAVPATMEPTPQHAGLVVDLLLEEIANATPAEIIEEGGYLLGASHLWADTQGTKATEHMVRRIIGADQVVRASLERELARLREVVTEYDALRDRLTAREWSSLAVMKEVQRTMEASY